MNVHPHMEERLPSVFIEELIDRHGAWRVLRDVAAVLVRRKRQRSLPAAQALSDHMRRDIGLPPVTHSPRHWDVRL